MVFQIKHAPTSAHAWIRDLDAILPMNPSDSLEEFKAIGIDNIPWCSTCLKEHRDACKLPLSSTKCVKCVNCVERRVKCDVTVYDMPRLLWMLTRLVRGLGVPPEPEQPEAYMTLSDGSVVHLVIDANGYPAVLEDL